ncbi:MAG: UDP-N-acetylmuramoyl-tripeptide--D-alanyl-D-alanine ligase [Candidatus Paceibacterota bacterium]|jgi:UDP-N-acetylmuramyl pentapeptide synthase
MKNILKTIVVKVLTIEARLVIKKYKPKIIAVTGSVGKTSTKDAIYTALLPFFHVRKSAKSFNSDLGIPLTILGLGNAWSDPKKWFANIVAGAQIVFGKKEYPSWLVLEIGADHPGEIEEVMKWIHPDISVVTRIGSVPVHVEHYKSVKEVIKEKSYLARGVKPDGFLILNADDEDVMGFKEYTGAKVVTFGIREKSDIQASYIQPVYEDGSVVGVSFKADIGGSSIPIILKNTLGASHVYPVLAAFAVVNALGQSVLKMTDAFETHDYPRGRMNIIEGRFGTTIVDDTYNASPVAMEEAFKTIEGLTITGRKIGVLGDMLELGKHSLDEHHRLGEYAAKVFDELVLVGIRARDMRESAEKEGFDMQNIAVFDTAEQAGEHVRSVMKKGDLVFVKGSQGMRMERAVERLIAHPERKARLLVRQEPEWLGKK